MGRYKDLTGQTFADGRLKVLHRAPSSRRIQWVCQCECGNICVVRGDYLKSGATKSCGCIPKGKQAGEMRAEEMKSGSWSLDALARDKGDPYQNLANAIVAVAADDYRMALKKKNTNLKKSMEEFFCSDWYRVLTSVNSENLMSMLRQEYTDNLCATNI